jgi:hypothetical protein
MPARDLWHGLARSGTPWRRLARRLFLKHTIPSKKRLAWLGV